VTEAGPVCVQKIYRRVLRRLAAALPLLLESLEVDFELEDVEDTFAPEDADEPDEADDVLATRGVRESLVDLRVLGTVR
jgi:hypothetical protein